MRIDDAIYTELMTAIETIPAACAKVSDDFAIRQLTLSGNLFIGSLNAGVDNLNAMTFRDIDFSLRDFESSIRSNGLEEEFVAIKESLRASVEKLRGVAGLKPEVISAAEVLKAKLNERKSAAERAVYRPPEAPQEPLPNDPATLAADADSLRKELNAAGFETPVMDELATTPESFQVRDCVFLIDEIDSILA